MDRSRHWSLRLPGAGRAQRPVGALLLQGAWAITGAAAIAAAAAPPVSAPPLDSSQPGWLQLETSLTVTPEVLETRWTSLVRLPNSRPDYSLAATAPPPAWNNVPAVAHFVELSANRPSGQAAQQVFLRPQFALGNSSDALRGWLRLAGIDATACTAPLMKMRSTFAGSSSRANVSLSARCSVH